MSNEDDLVRAVAMAVLESAIQSGDIELVGRSDAEVYEDYMHFVRNHIENKELDVEVEISHSDNLLTEASLLMERQNLELAVVVYATWVEHWLNGMIATALTRRGLSRAERRPVFLCNLNAKTGWLWQILFGEGFPTQVATDISQLADARNTFVHYKWPADADGNQVRSKLQRICDYAPALVSELGAIQDRVYFGGQRDRIPGIIRGRSDETC